MTDSSRSKPRHDVEADITAKIVAAIKAGAGEFQMPWHRPGLSFDLPVNALTGNSYRGANILSLWIDAADKQFERQVWATYRQWGELGCQVRKGEKAALVVKYGEWIPKDKRDDEDRKDEDDGKRLFAKPAFVFNCAQVAGFDLPPRESRPDLTVRLAHVDAFVAATRAEFRESGASAFYRPKAPDGSGDYIQMPPRNLFVGTATSTPTESFESTRLHELCHWVGAAGRLNRDFGKKRGDKAYAFEELVAELGAAFLCAGLEITDVPRADHAQYLGHWLEILAGDKRAIFSAASAASKAVDYLNGLQPHAPGIGIRQDGDFPPALP